MVPLAGRRAVRRRLFCSARRRWRRTCGKPPRAGEPDASAYRAIGLGVAAAFAVGLSILGAGYAVGRIGSAAMGAMAEKPELLPRTILFVALGEGLAVLGFAFAMMLLQKMSDSHEILLHRR